MSTAELIKWLGDFENLKHFMAELYDAGGVWNSSGGSAKVFFDDQIKLIIIIIIIKTLFTHGILIRI
jgi:hypothetical protein